MAPNLPSPSHKSAWQSLLPPEDVDAFIALATEENVEATPIATVTKEARVRMFWNDEPIVDISRDFLASNGAPKFQDVHVLDSEIYTHPWPGSTLEERLTSVMTDLNVASNKGLSERFDSTIGAATVLLPFGGATQLTPAMAMAAKLPVEGETNTCSGMAWGYNPYLSSANQYEGAYLAVVESLAKLVAAGFKREDTYLTFQEYFERLRNDPTRWGKPVASVLGALMAQLDLEIGAIGGKDSMSGSFESLDVPPTLVSFATAVGPVNRVTSPEFKEAGNRIVFLSPAYSDEFAHDELIPDAQGFKDAIATVEKLIGSGAARAVATPGYGNLAETLFKMCVGNTIGLALADTISAEALFTPAYGTFVVELAPNAEIPASTDTMEVIEAGITTTEYSFTAGSQSDRQTVDLVALQEKWEAAIESVFPYRTSAEERATLPEVEAISYTDALPLVSSTTIAKPRVIIPVFPGNNCEFDTARAFERAGAIPQTLIINNMTPQAVAESTQALVNAINKSQIIMIPGGFSGGDEPDGSAKFITAFFRAPAVTEAVRDLLQNRDGLMLGICNGFQALVKLGLVPYGDIVDMTDECPTLTFNSIGRHQSSLVRTRRGFYLVTLALRNKG